MRDYRKILFLALMTVVLLLEANTLIAQPKYSTLVGFVRGIHVHGLRKWLEVENETDKAIVNFRIGHKTVYMPHRSPHPGEKVKVEYLTDRGVFIAYTVTLLGNAK